MPARRLRRDARRHVRRPMRVAALLETLTRHRAVARPVLRLARAVGGPADASAGDPAARRGQVHSDPSRACSGRGRPQVVDAGVSRRPRAFGPQQAGLRRGRRDTSKVGVALRAVLSGRRRKSDRAGSAEMFQSDLLAGKRILITGGGSGLGMSMGRRFLELGAALAICGRRQEVLEATAAEHRAATGGEVVTCGCDIRDAAAVEAMLEQLFAARPLDALVNNAAGNFLCRSRGAVAARARRGARHRAARHRPTARSPAAAAGSAGARPARCSPSSPPTPGPARPTSCPRRWRRRACSR